jgi:hypothetical protein
MARSIQDLLAAISEHCSLSTPRRNERRGGKRGRPLVLPGWRGAADGRAPTDFGGIDRYQATVLAILLIDKGRAVKTATDRATEAIEAAERMFVDEIGAVLDLSPAAKVALISKIAAAIQAAVAEERERLIGAQ